jgi:hypothetical protein
MKDNMLNKRMIVLNTWLNEQNWMRWDGDERAKPFIFLERDDSNLIKV